VGVQVIWENDVTEVRVPVLMKRDRESNEEQDFFVYKIQWALDLRTSFVPEGWS
jgi:hypothetical protein